MYSLEMNGNLLNKQFIKVLLKSKKVTEIEMQLEK